MSSGILDLKRKSRCPMIFIESKITPDAPKTESGLIEMIMMGKSIRHIWVKHLINSTVIESWARSIFGQIGIFVLLPYSAENDFFDHVKQIAPAVFIKS